MKGHKLEGHGKAGFLLTNASGGYLALPNQPECRSNYEGLVLFKLGTETLFKSVENIYLDSPVEIVENHFHSVLRKSSKAQERFVLKGNSILYEVMNYEGFVNVDLDCRELYDYSDQGRIYQVYKQENTLIMEYKKYSDQSLKELKGSYYIVIEGVESFVPVKNWAQRNYAYDRRRKAKSDFFIYQTLRLRSQGKLRLVFTVHQDIESALSQSKKFFTGFDQEVRQAELETEQRYSSARLLPAVHALHSLVKDSKGILAGLPWFHQFWSRDTLISLHAFALQGKAEFVKKIIFSYMDNILEDGRLPNVSPVYSGSPLGSADGVGWLWKRVHDWIRLLQLRKQLSNVLSKSDLMRLKEKIELCLQRLHKEHQKDNLIVNNPKETWMDTIGREGARIEIQALQLSMYRTAQLLDELTSSYSEKHGWQEKQLAQAIKNKFFDGHLADGFVDGKADFTVRPNIFLAYYIYPELLSQEEWERALDKALERIWLPWGGLATLDRSHPAFKVEHTGQDDQSYHQGDSWYWINNLAALSLLRLNKMKYKEKIYKIIEASMNEMLMDGWLGHCAEISSASSRTSFGCLAQAWSAATLIELLEEVSKH